MKVYVSRQHARRALEYVVRSRSGDECNANTASRTGALRCGACSAGSHGARVDGSRGGVK